MDTRYTWLRDMEEVWGHYIIHVSLSCLSTVTLLVRAAPEPQVAAAATVLMAADIQYIPIEDMQQLPMRAVYNVLTHEAPEILNFRDILKS
jgi:hypothetical protein